MKRLMAAIAALLCLGASPRTSDYHFIPGSLEPNRGPDGNSVFLDAPEGLILVDTGRHPEHRDRLLAYARARGRPIVAIFNTHWHLDHSTGNAEIRAAYSHAELYASNAIEGALAGFLRTSREGAERALAAGQIPEANRAEVQRFLDVMDHPEGLRPTRPVTRSADMAIGGRRLRVNLARYAATEGDVWIYDRAARLDDRVSRAPHGSPRSGGQGGLIIAGDLVVAPVPFMDTACPEGWRRALDAIAATRFNILIPGHGDPMDRAQFLAWRRAYNAFVDCGGSDRPRAECIAGWRRDAAQFIPAGREAMVDGMAGYYIDSRLRSAPAERRRYCPQAD